MYLLLVASSGWFGTFEKLLPLLHQGLYQVKPRNAAKYYYED
jgi:hypothetical protein